MRHLGASVNGQRMLRETFPRCDAANQLPSEKTLLVRTACQEGDDEILQGDDADLKLDQLCIRQRGYAGLDVHTVHVLLRADVGRTALVVPSAQCATQE